MWKEKKGLSTREHQLEKKRKTGRMPVAFSTALMR